MQGREETENSTDFTWSHPGDRLEYYPYPTEAPRPFILAQMQPDVFTYAVSFVFKYNETCTTEPQETVNFFRCRQFTFHIGA